QPESALPELAGERPDRASEKVEHGLHPPLAAGTRPGNALYLRVPDQIESLYKYGFWEPLYRFSARNYRYAALPVLRQFVTFERFEPCIQKIPVCALTKQAYNLISL